MQNTTPQAPRPNLDREVKIVRKAEVVKELLPFLAIVLLLFILSLLIEFGPKNILKDKELAIAIRELAFAFLIGFVVGLGIGLPERKSRERDFRGGFH